MATTEDDGDEVFIPIKDVRCCKRRLVRDRGFWRCPSCGCSYGPADLKKRTA